MQAIINQASLFLSDYGPTLWEGTIATLYMVFVSTLFAYLIGLPVGLLSIITQKPSLLPAPRFHRVLDAVINIGRSIPFIILMIALVNVTRWIAGTSLGYQAAVVPLVIAAVPFVARLCESSILELDEGVVEAAQSMGASIPQLIFKVLLPETLPALVRGMSLTAITLVGYSAVAGAIGAGGLGHIAISYGYHRYQKDVLFVTLILLVVLVQLIQTAGNLIARRLDKKARI